MHWLCGHVTVAEVLRARCSIYFIILRNLGYVFDLHSSADLLKRLRCTMQI